MKTKAKKPTKKKYVLVKSSFNWADECDFEGFEVWNQKELEETKKEVKAFFDSGKTITVYFGTNEDREFHNYTEIFRNVEEIPLKDNEAKIINKIFNGRFGYPLSNVLDNMNDEDDDNEDYSNEDE